MFIGHYAVGFACNRVAPSASLGTLFMASLWVDLLWPVFLLLGIERLRIVPGITKAVPFGFEYYPFSHSLLAAALWAALLGLTYLAYRRAPGPAIVIYAAVLSHWFLDAIVHRPDLPITFTGPARVGLGLLDSIPATLLVEGGFFALGAYLYLSYTRALDRIGRYGAWVLFGLLVVICLGQLSGTASPNETIVAYAGLSQWLFALFGYRVDRHRGSRDKAGFGMAVHKSCEIPACQVLRIENLIGGNNKECGVE